MEAFSQTMNVKKNVTHLVTLRDARCARETCTYNELGEFLMASGIESAQDTAH